MTTIATQHGEEDADPNLRKDVRDAREDGKVRQRKLP